MFILEGIKFIKTKATPTVTVMKMPTASHATPTVTVTPTSRYSPEIGKIPVSFRDFFSKKVELFSGKI